MKRIDTSTAAEDLHGSGKDGFTDGDASAVPPVPPTVIDDSWCNAVQEEICNVIEGAGYVLNPESNTQLLDAVKNPASLTTASVAINNAPGSADAIRIKFGNGGNATNASQIKFQASRGSIGTPSIVDDGDVAGKIAWNAWNSQAYFEAANVRAVAGPWSHGVQYPTSIKFATTATTALVDRWEIASSGHLLPATDDTYDVGSSSKRVNTIYASDAEINHVTVENFEADSYEFTSERDITIPLPTHHLYKVAPRAVSAASTDFSLGPAYTQPIRVLTNNRPGFFDVVLTDGWYEAFYTIPKGVALKSFMFRYRCLSNVNNNAKVEVYFSNKTNLVPLDDSTQWYLASPDNQIINQASDTTTNAGRDFSFSLTRNSSIPDPRILAIRICKTAATNDYLVIGSQFIVTATVKSGIVF